MSLDAYAFAIVALWFGSALWMLWLIETSTGVDRATIGYATLFGPLSFLIVLWILAIERGGPALRRLFRLGRKT